METEVPESVSPLLSPRNYGKTGNRCGCGMGNGKMFT